MTAAPNTSNQDSCCMNQRLVRQTAELTSFAALHFESSNGRRRKAGLQASIARLLGLIGDPTVSPAFFNNSYGPLSMEYSPSPQALERFMDVAIKVRIFGWGICRRDSSMTLWHSSSDSE
jgi:hypothetical protein